MTPKRKPKKAKPVVAWAIVNLNNDLVPIAFETEPEAKANLLSTDKRVCKVRMEEIK